MSVNSSQQHGCYTQSEDNKPVIYIVDDDITLLDSLAFMLFKQGFNIKPYHCASDFLEGYVDRADSCILLDAQMPGMSGGELQAELLARHRDIPIIFISGHCDVSVIVSAIKKGAVDFLLKPLDRGLLLSAISDALAEGRRRREQIAHDDDVMACADSLTKREEEILQLIIGGRLSKTIAEELFISTNTVENHRAKIMKKMKAHSVAELVSLCLSHGLIDRDR